MGAAKAQKAKTETAKKPGKAKAAAEAEAKPAKKAKGAKVAEQCQPPLLSPTQENDTAIVISSGGADVERAPPLKRQKTEVRVNAPPWQDCMPHSKGTHSMAWCSV